MDPFVNWHPGYIAPTHVNCLICRCIARERGQLHVQNLVRMRAVAASLPLPYAPRRESEPRKQETPGIAVPEVSTAPTPVLGRREGRYVDGGTGPGQ